MCHKSVVSQISEIPKMTHSFEFKLTKFYQVMREKIIFFIKTLSNMLILRAVLMWPSPFSLCKMSDLFIYSFICVFCSHVSVMKRAQGSKWCWRRKKERARWSPAWSHRKLAGISQLSTLPVSQLLLYTLLFITSSDINTQSCSLLCATGWGRCTQSRTTN